VEIEGAINYCNITYNGEIHIESEHDGKKSLRAVTRCS